MIRTSSIVLTAALFAVSVNAQTQAGTQAGQASAQAGSTSAQASGGASTSGSASAAPGQANASLTNGTAFNASLNSPIDSKKAKAGDPVNARTTEAVKASGKTVIPKGAKLVGHVTQASAKANGDANSALGVTFDRAILKGGEEIPLNVTIQALASAQSGAAVAADDVDTMGGAGASATGSGRAATRGAVGGVTSTAGAAAGTVTNTAANAGNVAGGAVNSTTNAAAGVAGTSRGAVGGLNAAGQLTSNSQGVFGLNGLALNSATSSATQGSVITSAGKNVHLDSGTRLLLVTQSSASAQ